MDERPWWYMQMDASARLLQSCPARVVGRFGDGRVMPLAAGGVELALAGIVPGLAGRLCAIRTISIRTDIVRVFIRTTTTGSKMMDVGSTGRATCHGRLHANGSSSRDQDVQLLAARRVLSLCFVFCFANAGLSSYG